MIAKFAVEKERQQSQYQGGGGGDGSGSDDDSQAPHSYHNPSSNRKTGKKISTSSPKGKKSKKLHGGLSADSDIHQQSTEEKLADLEHQLQQQQQQMNQQQQYSQHNNGMNMMHQGQGLGQGPSMYMYPNNPSFSTYASSNNITGQLPLPAPSSIPYPSSSSSSSQNVSGPEAQFMARQKGDLGQNNYWPFQPPLGSPQHLKSLAGPYGTMGLAQGQGPGMLGQDMTNTFSVLNLGGNHFDSSTLIDTVGEAMRDRIVTLEKQVPLQQPY